MAAITVGRTHKNSAHYFDALSPCARSLLRDLALPAPKLGVNSSMGRPCLYPGAHMQYIQAVGRVMASTHVRAPTRRAASWPGRFARRGPPPAARPVMPPRESLARAAPASSGRWVFSGEFAGAIQSSGRNAAFGKYADWVPRRIRPVETLVLYWKHASTKQAYLNAVVRRAFDKAG